MIFADGLKYYGKKLPCGSENGHYGRLIKEFFCKDHRYSWRFTKVWLWAEFPYASQFSLTNDVEIDLVALTTENEYWAIGCRTPQQGSLDGRYSLDAFLHTSALRFTTVQGKSVGFSRLLWVATTSKSKWDTKVAMEKLPLSTLSVADFYKSNLTWDAEEDNAVSNSITELPSDTGSYEYKVIEHLLEHFKTADRGRLVMPGECHEVACRFAEKVGNGESRVLVIVDSLAQLGWVLNDWSACSKNPIKAVCACSKSQAKGVGGDIRMVDLPVPVVSKADAIATEFQSILGNAHPGLSVLFATHQSLDLVSKAQKIINQKSALATGFDLIICLDPDFELGGGAGTEFGKILPKIYDNRYILGRKRLYVTSVLSFYYKSVNTLAEPTAISAPDDKAEAWLGRVVYHLGMRELIQSGKMVDRKVLILSMSESDCPALCQEVASKTGEKISSLEVARIICSLEALSKRLAYDIRELEMQDPDRIRSVVAICEDETQADRTAKLFNVLFQPYSKNHSGEVRERLGKVVAKHITSSMSASQRDELLEWFTDIEGKRSECHILTCAGNRLEIGEFISPDAVLLLSDEFTPPKLIRAFTWVARKSWDKRLGYLILPVVVPESTSPLEELNQGNRYDKVWKVLETLSAMDERFTGEVNRLDLIRSMDGLLSDLILARDNPGKSAEERMIFSSVTIPEENYPELDLRIREFREAFLNRMVEHYGYRDCWEQQSIVTIEVLSAQFKELRERLLATLHLDVWSKVQRALRKNLDPDSTREDAVDFLALHLVVRPLFTVLLGADRFERNNPVATSLQEVVEANFRELQPTYNPTLERFLEITFRRLEGIGFGEGRYRLLGELCEKLLVPAFPSIAERLKSGGMPDWLMDFLLRSVNVLLYQELGTFLSARGTRILEPFAGVGRFSARLLLSGLVKSDDLARKGAEELYVNESNLLAYYVASVGMEILYRGLISEVDGNPCRQVCLADSFRLAEATVRGPGSKVLSENLERSRGQRKTAVQVILSDLRFVLGSGLSERHYPNLEAKISDLGVGTVTDRLIRLVRWVFDRLDAQTGGIAVLTAGEDWLESGNYVGLRQYLEEKFSSVYVLRLHRSMVDEISVGKNQDPGDGLPSVVLILVRTPDPKLNPDFSFGLEPEVEHELRYVLGWKSSLVKAKIYYRDLEINPDGLDEIQKLAKFSSILDPRLELLRLYPSHRHDWIDPQEELYKSFMPLVGEANAKGYFAPISTPGCDTGRDAWVYNFSLSELKKTVRIMLRAYNDNVKMQQAAEELNVRGLGWQILDPDSTMLHWTPRLMQEFSKGRLHSSKSTFYRTSLYRPYVKMHHYFDPSFNENPGSLPEIFSDGVAKRMICVPLDSERPFSVLITDCVPDFKLFKGGVQCFPLNYSMREYQASDDLFIPGKVKPVSIEGISDFALSKACQLHGRNCSREEVFYYIYGLLHSPDYRSRFASGLRRSFPRIPLLEDTDKFQAFVTAGRRLADMHLHYETWKCCMQVEIIGLESGDFRVERMRFDGGEKSNEIIYNSHIRIKHIPLAFREYMIDGRSAVEHFMEGYSLIRDWESGIVNDPNADLNNPREILDRLLRIIQVSLDTVKIVRALPHLSFDEIETPSSC